jgi:hypothetical protein
MELQVVQEDVDRELGHQRLRARHDQRDPGRRALDVQVFAARMDACWRTALPAAVTTTDETIVIEVTHPMAGCESIRYTIRNDGSGGIRETKYGERWVRNKFDFDLTPVK